MLGAGTLKREGYIPNNSAYVSGSGQCWCLSFKTRIFEAAVDASVPEGVTSKVEMGMGMTIVVLGDRVKG